MARRALGVVVLVCGLLVGFAVPATAGGHGIRVLTVMTFNIHHAAGTDGVLDLDRVARVIRRGKADVVGLQEVDRHHSDRSEWVDQAGTLARDLGYHVVFGANIDREPPEAGAPRVQYGTAILSRYPITDWDNTYLYRSPDQEQRGLLRAEVDVRGTPVHVYNTHLAASSQTDRAQQTKEIVAAIGDRRRAVLVGDLNALPGSPEIETVDEALTDVWPVAGIGPGATYPAERPDRRIDYIYSGRGMWPVWARVGYTDPVASDHLPLLSRFLVSTAGT